MAGPEENVKYPETPKADSKKLNEKVPKTRRDHYKGIEAPPVPPLEESQLVRWIKTRGKEKEDPSRYMMPPAELPYRKLPLSVKYASCNTRHIKEVGAFRTILPELFGDAGYKAIDDAYASFADSEFRTAQARGMLKDAPNCSLKDIASFICTVYDIQNWPVVIGEARYDAPNERVRIQLYKGLPKYCPYDVRQGDFRLCAATAAYERELVKMCNPRYKAFLSRTKGIGDDCCELTIERDPDYKGK